MAGFPLPHEILFHQLETKFVNLIPQASARRDFREPFMRSFGARGFAALTQDDRGVRPAPSPLPSPEGEGGVRAAPA